MDDLEIELKNLIINRFGNLKKFTENVNMPWTTLDSVLKRGINNTNITNVIKICEGLSIDCESLYYGRILPKQELVKMNPLTTGEIEHMEKYRTIDKYGKDMIDTVLDKELERVRAQAQRRSKTEQAKEFIMLEPPKVIPSYQGITGASAGTGQYIFDDLVPDMVEVDSDCNADFVIDVRGDSMLPTYNDGDGLLVKRQDTVNVGEIGIFMVDNEAYVKECGGDRLISHNKNYDEILLKEHQDISCIGKVLGKL